MQTGPSTQAPRAWLTFSNLNMPLSSAIQMTLTLRCRSLTLSSPSLSPTSPSLQMMLRKLLRKLTKTLLVERMISQQKSSGNAEPTYPTLFTSFARNLSVKARFSPPNSRTRSSPLSTRRVAEPTLLNTALSPLPLTSQRSLSGS